MRMKRTKLARGTRISRGDSKLSRTTRIRPIGKRGAADREAIAAVRAEVLKRAENRCERCKRPSTSVGPLDLHHRLARSQGGGHEAANLRALCRVCHAQVHAGSADAGRWIVTRKGAA